MGFIFYKNSPRFFDKNISLAQLTNNFLGIEKVGVFVNETSDAVLELVTFHQLDAVQLHGDESSDFCAGLCDKVTVIKAFQMDDGFDFSALRSYLPYVGYFLFDTATKNYGGSGEQFNWQKLHEYHFEKPFFLSGGIDDDSQEKIKQFKHPQLFGIDLNSKFETQYGIKNYNKLKNFIKKLNNDSNEQ